MKSSFIDSSYLKFSEFYRRELLILSSFFFVSMSSFKCDFCVGRNIFVLSIRSLVCTIVGHFYGFVVLSFGD